MTYLYALWFFQVQNKSFNKQVFKVLYILKILDEFCLLPLKILKICRKYVIIHLFIHSILTYQVPTVF